MVKLVNFVVLLCFPILSIALSSLALLGPTGDGKSSSGNAFVQVLGHETTDIFVEGSSIYSETKIPQSFVVGNLKITDTPGLMDTEGLTKDEAHVEAIVEYLAKDKYINGFIIVLNEQNIRFTSPLQNAIKLLVDSFGPDMLSHMGILFTRAISRTAEQAQFTVQSEIIPALEKLTGQSIPLMPFWQIETHPEKLTGPPLYIPHSSLEAMQQHKKDTVLQIKQWVEKLPALDVSDAKPGEYVVTQERKREAAELKRQHDEAINPDKTTNNCRERELRRRDGETERYGPRCYGPVGPKKYKDYWQDVDYVRECQTTYYKNSGGQQSQSAWISTGEFIRQEGRWTKHMC